MPVKRLHTVVWIISSVLAFVGLFLRAGVVGVSIGQVLGPEVLLPALGAAVIGRMEKMPTIVGAAIGLGDRRPEREVRVEPGRLPRRR